MDGKQLLATLGDPLTPFTAAVFILIGLYSLIINVADANHKDYPRAEKTARIGGWFYIAVGAVVLLVRTFS